MDLKETPYNMEKNNYCLDVLQIHILLQFYLIDMVAI